MGFFFSGLEVEAKPTAKKQNLQREKKQTDCILNYNEIKKSMNLTYLEGTKDARFTKASVTG